MGKIRVLTRARRVPHAAQCRRPTRRSRAHRPARRVGAASAPRRRWVAGARRRCASRRRRSSERSRRSRRLAACARSRRSWSRRRRPQCAASVRACGMLRMWWPSAADNQHNGTDNRYNSSDNRNNGTGYRNNGTDNRHNGTDYRYNGAVIANNGTDNREHRCRSSILRDRSPPNSALLVGLRVPCLTAARARVRTSQPVRPSAPQPPNQPTPTPARKTVGVRPERARQTNHVGRANAWVGHVGFRACPSAAADRACGRVALARGRGGAGPRQGWHWPAAGVALARSRGGTGPRAAERGPRRTHGVACVAARGAVRASTGGAKWEWAKWEWGKWDTMLSGNRMQRVAQSGLPPAARSLRPPHASAARNRMQRYTKEGARAKWEWAKWEWAKWDPMLSGNRMQR
jgi:hypothetical protein